MTVPLSQEEKRLLVTLADPQADPPEADAVNAVAPERIDAIIAHHAVGAMARRKLRALGEGLSEPHREALAERSEADEIAAAVTLDLEARGHAIRAAFDEAGIGYALVKGAVFATALYDDPVDRPFTDIDMLTAAGDEAKAGEVLRALGYEQSLKAHFDHSESNREQKWVAPGARWVLVELHGDLVHMPALRRRVRYDLDVHRTAGAEGAEGAAHLCVAAVHAAAGHKFHNLRLLTDVLQAMRRLSETDMSHLATVWRRLSLGPELSQSLHLAGALFGERERAQEVVATLGLPAPSALVGSDQVLDTFCDRLNLSRVRRHLFRHRQIIGRRN